MLTGDFILALSTFFVVLDPPSFSSTNLSNFSHLETMILGVTGVDILIPILFLLISLEATETSSMPELLALDWAADCSPVRLHPEERFTEDAWEDRTI